MERASVDQLASRSWYITCRWQAYEGEIRAAILRIGLVIVFYSLHLLHHFLWSEQADEDWVFHRVVTWLAAGWLFVSLAVLVSLRQRFYPPFLKFATTSMDLVLLTASACLGAGPASPLVFCYFVIIAMSTLRFSLPLVWLATLGSMAGFMAIVGMADSTWFDATHATPPINQLVMLASLAATGIAIGQLIRMIRNSASEYVARYVHLEKLEHEGEGQAS